jgi:hypothetical protein
MSGLLIPEIIKVKEKNRKDRLSLMTSYDVNVFWKSIAAQPDISSS